MGKRSRTSFNNGKTKSNKNEPPKKKRFQDLFASKKDKKNAMLLLQMSNSDSENSIEDLINDTPLENINIKKRKRIPRNKKREKTIKKPTNISNNDSLDKDFDLILGNNNTPENKTTDYFSYENLNQFDSDIDLLSSQGSSNIDNSDSSSDSSSDIDTDDSSILPGKSLPKYKNNNKKKKNHKTTINKLKCKSEKRIEKTQIKKTLVTAHLILEKISYDLLGNESYDIPSMIKKEKKAYKKPYLPIPDKDIIIKMKPSGAEVKNIIFSMEKFVNDNTTIKTPELEKLDFNEDGNSPPIVANISENGNIDISKYFTRKRREVAVALNNMNEATLYRRFVKAYKKKDNTRFREKNSTKWPRNLLLSLVGKINLAETRINELDKMTDGLVISKIEKEKESLKSEIRSILSTPCVINVTLGSFPRNKRNL